MRLLTLLGKRLGLEVSLGFENDVVEGGKDGDECVALERLPASGRVYAEAITLEAEHLDL